MPGVELCTASRHKLCMSKAKVIGEGVWKYHVFVAIINHIGAGDQVSNSQLSHVCEIVPASCNL